MPEDPEQETLKFEDLLTRHVVVHFKEGVVRPVLFMLVVVPDSRADTRIHNTCNTANADVSDLEDALTLLVRPLTVEDVETTRQMWDWFPILPPLVKPAPFYHPELCLTGHRPSFS